MLVVRWSFIATFHPFLTAAQSRHLAWSDLRSKITWASGNLIWGWILQPRQAIPWRDLSQPAINQRLPSCMQKHLDPKLRSCGMCKDLNIFSSSDKNFFFFFFFFFKSLYSTQVMTNIPLITTGLGVIIATTTSHCMTFYYSIILWDPSLYPYM